VSGELVAPLRVVAPHAAGPEHFAWTRLGQPLRDEAARPPLVDSERPLLLTKKSNDNVLQLVVFITKDQVAEALVNRINRRSIAAPAASIVSPSA